jgi:hypothetical protein
MHHHHYKEVYFCFLKLWFAACCLLASHGLIAVIKIRSAYINQQIKFVFIDLLNRRLLTSLVSLTHFHSIWKVKKTHGMCLNIS